MTVADPAKSTFVFPGTDESFYSFAMSNPVNGWTSTAEGGYGQVYVFTKGDVQYILKRGVTSRARGTRSDSAIPEIEILMALDGSKYAMQLDAAIVFDTDSYVLSRYVPGKTMDKWLTTNPSRDERIRVYNELLKGIQEIHSKGIIHRDIKEENIWIPDDASLSPFYIDFGISVPVGTEAVYIGTDGYKSPYPEGKWKHESDLDYYSLGVIFEKNPIEGAVLGLNLKKQGITNEEAAARKFEGGRRRRGQKQRGQRGQRRSMKRRIQKRSRSTRRSKRSH